MELPQIAVDGRRTSVTDGGSNGDMVELSDSCPAEAQAKWRKVSNALTAVDCMTAVKDKQLLRYRRSQQLSEQHARQLQEKLWKEVEEKEKLQFRLQEQQQEMDHMSGMLKVAHIALAAKENSEYYIDGEGEEDETQDDGKSVVTLKVLRNRVRLMRAHQKVTSQVIKDQLSQISSAMQTEMQQGIEQLCDMMRTTAQPHEGLVQTPVHTPSALTKPSNGAPDGLQPVVVALEKAVVASVLAVNNAIESNCCPFATVQPINEDAPEATIDARLRVCTTSLADVAPAVKQLGQQLLDCSHKLSTPARVRFTAPKVDKSPSSRPGESTLKEGLRITGSPLTASFELEAPRSPKPRQLVFDAYRSAPGFGHGTSVPRPAMPSACHEGQSSGDTGPFPQTLRPTPVGGGSLSKPQEVALQLPTDVRANSRGCERSHPDKDPSTAEVPYTFGASDEFLPPRRYSEGVLYDPATQERTPTKSHAERQRDISKALTLAETALDSLQHDDHTTISNIVNEVQDALQGNSMKRKRVSVAEQVAVLRLKEWIQKRKEAFERRQQMLRECFRLLQVSRPVLDESLTEAQSAPLDDPPASAREKPGLKIPRPPSMVLQAGGRSPSAQAPLSILVPQASELPQFRSSPTPRSPMPPSPRNSVTGDPRMRAVRASTDRSARGSLTHSSLLKSSESPSKRNSKARVPLPEAPLDMHIDRLVASCSLPNIDRPRQSVQ